MIKRLFLLLVAYCIGTAAVAQEQELPFVKVNYVIVQSVKNYDSAKVTANAAAKQLRYKLDLRGLKPNKKNGLSFSKKDCENEGGYPCYIARGRYDAGKYVSIEWSDAIDGFAKGYYVVIVASGDQALTKASLKQAKPFFKDAYSKSASVYIGCMH